MTITELIRRQAQRTPDAVAVSCADRVATYRELVADADRLARRLRDRGVRDEDVVVVSAERGVDLVVALLGILTAGGAYLAVPGDRPVTWRAKVLADARPRLMLADKLNSGLWDGLGTPVHSLEEELAATDPGTASPLPRLTGDQLAYLSYTSGSTGEPKGVCVPHRGIVRLVDQPDWARFGPADTFLMLSPVAFDASTLEIWAPLGNGGRLAVFPPGEVTPERLARTVADEGVSVLWLTAGLFHQLVDAMPEAFAGLRHVLAGGDVVSSAHVGALLAAHPGVTFTNGYGPTENTTFTTCWTSTTAPEGAVPVGRAIRGTRIAVLDENLDPVEPGVTGEVYAAGAGLARCYLNRPGATAERFLPDLTGGAPGERMYRTGDLGRLRPDGVLEFAGRADRQVKVNGYRVEPGEIESALRALPGVRDAVIVTDRDAGTGMTRLVGYVVADGLEPAGIAEGLRGALPRHLVPWPIITLPALPLNPNGKVDRAALPVPPREEPQQQAAAAAEAGTDLEGIVTQAWRVTLGASRIGPRDSFFDVGGNSLLMIKLRAEIQRALGRKVNTIDLFHNPTIEQQVRHLRGEARDDAPVQLDRAVSQRTRAGYADRARRRMQGAQ
ncbi:non-ribosomal peptide synthetase [Streptomyces sp. SP17BM10]|uniref:non-ribosomal peptide synthetase n=1 Tax=Streptomyces sp. SP17BM10 TaxID=3002530 RepID=UPI002E780DBB|nr:non-ribosomal peptide synthetase [Streptomyces sp. SP17BM10]MEE1784662.1 non-ribosomal peptide synthetase [Streptomyces sp. SP17BM10]